MNAGSDPSSVVQDFLQSLQGNQDPSQGRERLFTTLQDLLSPSSTLSYVESADTESVDNLLGFLPSSLLLLTQDIDAEDADAAESNPELSEAIKQSLDLSQKKDILFKVLHSPQFSQSLASLTVALREGGLPSISEALKIPVEHDGYMRRGGVPIGGGDAVAAFLEGAKIHVKGKSSNQEEHDMNMQTDRQTD